MKLLKMRSGEHQCLVYSLAMLLDEDPDVLIEELGHDGTGKWFPKWEIPYCYRGHHMQEVVDVCIRRGVCLTPIEVFPRVASQRDPSDWRALWSVEYAVIRFKKMVEGRPGILIGNAKNGGGHACAWDGNIVFDPNGRNYSLQEFQALECWISAITSEN